MGVLDQITKMKKQGIPEEEIVSNLSQSGSSPKEINDALKQAQIKNAVSDFDDEMQNSMDINEEAPSPIENEPMTQEEYQPQQPKQKYASPQRDYVPMTQEEYQPQSPQQEQYAPQEYQPQQYSPQENYSNYSQGTNNTDTIIEISEQIFSDKIRKFQKQGDANSEAVALLQTKVEGISERLKKVETIIDKLQIAILEKVGSYGQNLEGIKKEMSMMQDSFSKMISPSKEIKKPAQQSQQQSQEEYFPSESENIKESLKNISRKK